jgi:hypothetical protein
MASKINPYNIDGTFPVANQDNPSQGFRDNFTNIKTNFLAAENEISDLQSKALLTSALDNGQSLNNDMAGTQIRRPQLAAWTQTLLDNGAVRGPISLDFNQANFQKITTGGTVRANFINWPASYGVGALGYGVMRVWINVTDIKHTLVLPSSVNIGIADVAGYDPESNQIMFDATGDYIFDFSSINGGTTYEIFDITRNRGTFRDVSFYYDNGVGSNFYYNFHYGLPTAKSYSPNENTIINLGSYNSWGVGALSEADIAAGQTVVYSDPIIGSTPLAGYTMTAARGNLQINNTSGLVNNTVVTPDPVQSNDPLGQINTLAFTGNGTGNAFNQLSSIAFYATGSDVQQGLGGNIAIFTSQDGYTNVTQAVGIENDQSVAFYGNVITSNIYVPVSATSSGTAGQISFDSSYIYVCTAPDTWVRASLSTW